MGAGPAGLSLIHHLAGHCSILLVDRQEPGMGKLCSGLLTSRAQAELPAPLPRELIRQPEFAELEYHDLDLNLHLKWPVDYQNVDRDGFDRWLWEVAPKDGVEARFHASVREVEREGDHFRLVVSQGERREEYRARLVVDASGWRSITRRARGEGAPLIMAVQAEAEVHPQPANHWGIFRTAFTDWFAWLVPQQERVLMGCGLPYGGEGRGLRAAERMVEFFLGEVAPAFGLAIRPGRVRGCPLTKITSLRQVDLGDGMVLRVGEAAGLVSPSSGDGISYGLSSGRKLARVLREVGLSPEDARERTTRYRKSLREEIGELRLNVVKARMMASPWGRWLGSAIKRLGGGTTPAGQGAG